MKDKLHPISPLQKILGAAISIAVNGGLFLLIVLSSGSSEAVGSSSSSVARQNIFCRYIANGRLFQLEVQAVDWQEAEEITCGAHLRDVHLSPGMIEGARLILDKEELPLLLAQRESCSCSQEERVPILQDIGIVEAPRLGADTRQTALPRIINTPEPSQDNTVTTNATNPQNKTDRPQKKSPSIDDLLNAASDFDEARPISDVDPGGSADGSRLSKSTTGKGDPYLQKIKAMLDNNMNAPASIPKSQLQKLSARVWVKIGKDGKVWSWDFYKKSGNAAFDKMIEMTIKQFMMGGSLRFEAPNDQWLLQVIPFVVEGKDVH